MLTQPLIPPFGTYGCALTSSDPVPIPDQVPCSASRTRFRVSPAGFRVSQSESRAHLGFQSRIRVSQRQSWILCWCVQCVSPPRIIQPLGRQVIPLPQGGRATGPSPGAGYRAGAGGTRFSRWAAWRCGFDFRGGPREVHPRAHARSAPHGADSGEGRVAPSTGWAGSSLGLGPAPVQPARLEARHAASASEGRSRATQEREQPLPIGRSPGRAGSPLRLGWGLVQIQPARSKRRQAARASPGRSRATQGREQPLPPRQSPGRAGSPLGWGPAEIQPARL